MQAYIDQLIKDGAFAALPKEAVYAIAMVLTALIVLSVLLPMSIVEPVLLSNVGGWSLLWFGYAQSAYALEVDPDTIPG